MYSMAGGVLGGMVLAALAAHVPALVPSWCRPKRIGASPRRVYVLLVQMKLNPALGGAKAFKAAWAALAADVKANEPNCLSYELCEDAADPDSIIIYERYVSPHDLDVTHAAGAAFKAFGKRLNEGELKGLVLSREPKRFFWESTEGFMERA